MTQNAMKKMYQLLLTEPHAPTVCAQLERIAREALEDHAMQEVQRLGQEIEQEPVAWVSEDVCEGQYIDGRPRKIWWECEKGVGTAFYTTPPQRKPLTDEQIADIVIEMNGNEPTALFWRDLAKAIEAAHGIKENT